MQKRFKKFKFEKVELLQKERIKYRENKIITKRFYDDKIVSMRLNFIKMFKDKKLKGNKNK